MRFLEFLIISPILTLVTCQVNNTVTNSKSSTRPLHAPANNVLVLSTFDPNNKPLTVNFDGKSEMNHMVLVNRFTIQDILGAVNDDLDFKYGNGVAAHVGCGLTFKGQFWYFGGYGKVFNRQVIVKGIIYSNINSNINNLFEKKANKIVGCEMARQFDLPFDFESGSCNTFYVPEEKVLMCFSASDPNTCHM